MSETRTSTFSSWHLWLVLAALAPIAVLIVGPPLTPWQVRPIFESRLVVVAAAVFLTALLLLGPTFRAVSPFQRSVLTALRLLVVVLVVVFMMRPTCVTELTRRQSASLVVLLDQSRSMTLPSTSGATKSRWQAQREALEAAQQQLADLARDLDVKVYSYDALPEPLTVENGKIAFPDQPTGDETDIGTSLYEAAVAKEVGSRLAGVILLGDGTQTTYAPGVEMFQAGRELAQRGAPLYTVAFGPVGDAAQARDVEVEYLPDQYSVFARNELIVRAVVRVRLYVNNDIPVELIVEDESGASQVVATQTIRAKNSDEPIDVKFSYTPEEPGQYKLTVRAAQIPQERVTKNNELSAFLTVFEGGLRVLYLEGELRPEQKFLRLALDASQDVEVDFQWIDKRLRDRWPLQLAEFLREEDYDVFILGDLDSSALWREGDGEQTLRVLAEQIEKQGKGLIMLGGYHSFGPGLYGKTPLSAALPITTKDTERQDFGGDIREDLHLGQVRMNPTGAHYLTRLASGEENDPLWQSLPPLLGANKFAGLKSSARVLAESPDGAPLLVAGEFGAGRVLAFAGDSTWRWWMMGHADEHRRFWRQIVLWLARRDDLVQDDVWLKLPQRRFDPGTRVEFTGGAKTSTGEVIADARFEGVLTLPDGAAETIELSRDGDGVVGRIDDTSQPGVYRMELVGRNNERTLGAARATFEIFDRDVELANSAANPDQLRRLAERTAEFRGRAVTPEELPAALEEIRANLPPLELTVKEPHELFDSAAAAWGLFLLVVLLLTGEWILRKRWSLV
ncbi:MAG: glutamine amidotransferase [Pirellulaceae bacterium]